MPDTNEGPAGTVKETEAPAPAKDNPLPGFAEAMAMAFPPEPEQGEPKGESAVETSADAKAPDAKVETPAAKPDAPKAEEKPDPAKTVNFDGFSDKQKTTWERLLKQGQVTADEVETARKESLFQASWTRNHQRLADERKAFEAERAKAAESLSMIEKIRANPALEAAVKSVLNGEATASPEDGADFISRADAERIAEEKAQRAYDKREREKQEQVSKQNAVYTQRQQALFATVKEQAQLLGVDWATMKTYVKAEEERLGANDIVLALDPETLAYNLQLRHEAAQAKAEAAALREQVSQRTSKQVQASKQSLPPAPRVTAQPNETLMQKVLRESGLTSLKQVPGLGWDPEG